MQGYSEVPFDEREVVTLIRAFADALRARGCIVAGSLYTSQGAESVGGRPLVPEPAKTGPGPDAAAGGASVAP